MAFQIRDNYGKKYLQIFYFSFEAIYLKVKRFIVSFFNPKLIKNNAMKLNMAVPSIDDIDIKT